MSSLRNDPDGHLELGLRIRISEAKDESDGERWAVFAEALLEDAIKWNESLPQREAERERDEIHEHANSLLRQITGLSIEEMYALPDEELARYADLRTRLSAALADLARKTRALEEIRDMEGSIRRCNQKGCGRPATVRYRHSGFRCNHCRPTWTSEALEPITHEMPGDIAAAALAAAAPETKEEK